MYAPDNQASQGDLHFHRIGSLPKGAIKVDADKHNGEVLLAKSALGHHHVAEFGDLYRMEGRTYLSVEKESGVVISHLKSGGHEPYRLRPGVWEVRRQRESSSLGDLPVED